MNQQNKTERWEEEFDRQFTCVVTYEKWPNEEEQRLREPQYKFKDFPNTNPKTIKNFITQLLSDARREERERCLEALPKRATEGDGWDMLNGKSCCPGDDCADGFNQAITTAEESIKKLKDND